MKLLVLLLGTLSCVFAKNICAADPQFPQNLIQGFARLIMDAPTQPSTTTVLINPNSFSSAKRSLVLSVNEFDGVLDNSMKFDVDGSVSTNQITLLCSSSEITWTLFGVNYLVFGFTDISTGTLTFSSIGAQNSQTVIIPTVALPVQISENNPQAAVFLCGIDASGANIGYSIQNNQGPLSVTLKAGSGTTVSFARINYVVYVQKSANYIMDYFQFIFSLPASSSFFALLQTRFSPVTVYLGGVYSLSSPPGNLKYKFIVTEDRLLEFQCSTANVQSTISVLAVGVPFDKICAKCLDKIVFQTSCVSECPAATYIEADQVTGYVSCITCLPKLNKVYDPSKKECVCAPSYELNSEICVFTGSTCTNGKIIDQVSQVCVCPVNQTPNPITGNCECVLDSILKAGICELCPKGFASDGTDCIPEQIRANCLINQTPANEICECAQGFIRINSLCIACSSDRIFDNLTKSCVCKPNSIAANNQDPCVCATNYVFVGGFCTPCPSGTSFDTKTQRCQNVLSACATNEELAGSSCVCRQGFYRNNNICTQCQNTYIYNVVSGACECPSFSSEDRTTFTCTCERGRVRVGDLCIRCLDLPSTDPLQSQCPRVTTQCGANQALISGRCQCRFSFELKGGLCVPCPKSTIYDFMSRTCICPLNEELSVTGLCECVAGTYRVDGTICSNCQTDTVWDGKACIEATSPCQANETLGGSVCQCRSGYIRVSGKCQQCPAQRIYVRSPESCTCRNGLESVQLLGSCECPSGKHIIDGICQTCAGGTVFSNGRCTSPSPVTCSTGLFLSNAGVCVACPSKCTSCVDNNKCSNCAIGYSLNTANLCDLIALETTISDPIFSMSGFIIDMNIPSLYFQVKFEDLQKMVKATFFPLNANPRNIIFSQHPVLLNQVRVFLDYENHPFFKNFSVGFTSSVLGVAGVQTLVKPLEVAKLYRSQPFKRPENSII